MEVHTGLSFSARGRIRAPALSGSDTTTEEAAGAGCSPGGLKLQIVMTAIGGILKLLDGAR